jgi:hypothetical protein
MHHFLLPTPTFEIAVPPSRVVEFQQILKNITIRKRQIFKNMTIRIRQIFINMIVRKKKQNFKNMVVKIRQIFKRGVLEKHQVHTLSHGVERTCWVPPYVRGGCAPGVHFVFFLAFSYLKI